MRFQVPYTGASPGANSNDYVLLSSIGISSQWKAQQIARVYLCLFNSAAGTLKDYFSQNGGATWTIRSTTAVGARTTDAYDIEYFVEPFKDWKLVWTNGGSAQATFLPAISLSTERVAAI